MPIEIKPEDWRELSEWEYYNSPLKVFEREAEKEAKRFAKEFDEATMKIIREYGIVVDKEELIKALAYDRDQYGQGYLDGYAKGREDAVVHAHWEGIANGFMVCSHCKESVEENRKYSFCPLCGAQMDEKESD